MVRMFHQRGEGQLPAFPQSRVLCLILQWHLKGSIFADVLLVLCVGTGLPLAHLPLAWRLKGPHQPYKKVQAGFFFIFFFVGGGW